MKVGIAGPISLDLLRDLLPEQQSPQRVQSFPLIALIARELYQQGHQLSVFALSAAVDRTTCLRGLIDVHLCPWRSDRRMLADGYRVEQQVLQDAMGRSDCEVIHAHWTYEFALAALASGKPTLVTAHDAPLWIPFVLPQVTRFVRLLLAFRVMKQASNMTAVSPYVADHLRRWMRYRGALTVVPNGLPPQIFDCGRTRLKTRGGNGRTFATLGEWGHLKNNKKAIRAFALVRRTLSDARMIMFGSGMQTEGPAQQWALRRGLADGIEFAGRMRHDLLMQRLSEQVDVVVHPSLEEAHPMAVTEAMALALPVIGGKRSGGVPWTLDHGEAGVLVNIKDAKHIADAMLSLARNSELRRQLSEKAYKHASEQFTIERTCQRYSKVYDSLLAQAVVSPA